MVCSRCIKSVENIFRKNEIPVKEVALGSVETEKMLTEQERLLARKQLQEEGFDLADDQRMKLVAQIRSLIVQLVHYSHLDEMNEILSVYLAKHLHRDYTYLSNLFSSLEPVTIEHYFILQKIEKVKEWLVYNEFTLSEIADKLGYSSVAHLSNQFEKITGFTPTQFRKLKDHSRRRLDRV